MGTFHRDGLSLQINTAQRYEETDIHEIGINKFRNTFFQPFVIAVYDT
jgi:hypothetical protein